LNIVVARCRERNAMDSVAVNLLKVTFITVLITFLGFTLLTLSGCQKISTNYAGVDQDVDNAPQYTVKLDPNRSPASKP